MDKGSFSKVGIKDERIYAYMIIYPAGSYWYTWLILPRFTWMEFLTIDIACMASLRLILLLKNVQNLPTNMPFM